MFDSPGSPRRRRRRVAWPLTVALAVFLAGVLLPLSATPATAADWYFETLDGHQTGPNGQINANVGAYKALTLYAGQPHVWYCDTTNGDLRHAWWTGTAWHFETLDGHQTGPNGQINASVGLDSAVTLYAGQPHVWYRDSSNEDLRHAWYG